VLWKVLTPVFKKTKKLMDALNRFTIDWFGEEGDHVHPRRPGVLERITKLEAELSHNGGKSVKDVVNKINTRLEDGNERFEALERRVGTVEETIKS